MSGDVMRSGFIPSFMCGPFCWYNVEFVLRVGDESAGVVAQNHRVGMPDTFNAQDGE